MIPYKFKSSHRLKLQHSDWREILVKDFFAEISWPPMRTLKFITGHVIYNPAYTYKFQLKITLNIFGPWRRTWASNFFFVLLNVLNDSWFIFIFIFVDFSFSWISKVVSSSTLISRFLSNEPLFAKVGFFTSNSWFFCTGYLVAKWVK